MDTQIATWEMNLEPAPVMDLKEEIAAGPMEPYVFNPQIINWN
jgi:hypothetical protein